MTYNPDTPFSGMTFGQLASFILDVVDDPSGTGIPAGNIDGTTTFGASLTVPYTGAYTFPSAVAYSTLLSSATALATPSALAATALNAFASTVSGATLMGFGTTHDVALKNRAGTTVFGVVANSTQIDLVAATAGVRGGATSTTLYQSNGSTVAYQYLAAGAVGIGTAAAANVAFNIQNTASASGTAAIGVYARPTMVAAANNDTLYGLITEPTFTPGAFTGLGTYSVLVGARSIATFTTPATARQVGIGVLTGTGAGVAVALEIAPPTGAATNYLIAHTTAATFNVTASGAITTASTITAGGLIQGTAQITNLVAGSATITNQSSVNGAGVLFSAVGKNSGGTDRTARMGLNVFADDVWSLDNGTTEYLRVNLTNGAITAAGAVTVDSGGTGTANAGLVVAGSAYGAGVASVRLNGLTSGAAAQTGTLTNAPTAGNPSFWIPINIAGAVRYIPAWT